MYVNIFISHTLLTHADTGEIDANLTETVQLHSKPSGMLWLTRRKSLKDKDGSHREVTSSEIVELPPPLPTPPTKQGRPNPIKMLSDSALVAATAVVRPRRAPSRANSMASTLTTTTVSSNHTVTSNHALASNNALTSNNAVTSLSPPSADGSK